MKGSFPAVCLVILAMLTSCSSPTDPAIESGFLNRTVLFNQDEHRYQVFIPHDYSPEADWPVLLFLHGSGERGQDGLIQTEVGLGRAIRRNADRFPAIAIFPQLPSGMQWTDETAQLAMGALDQTIAEFSVDSDRVTLTGLSQGGYGSLFLASRFPDRFDRVAPICPTVGAIPRYPALFGTTFDEAIEGLADALAGLPVWIFHGSDDSVLPVVNARALAAALQSREADIQYTEYPDVGHNAWDPAYASEALIQWMIAEPNAAP